MMEYQGASSMSAMSALSLSNGATLSLRADADSTFASGGLSGLTTSGNSRTIQVNSLNSPAGNNHTLSISGAVAGGTGTSASPSTLNITSTTGDTLRLANTFTVTGTGSGAWASDRLALNLSGANMVINGLAQAGVNGGISVDSSTGNSLTITGNVTTSASRTLYAQVNTGTLNLNNTTGTASGANWGFFVNLVGGTLNVNNAVSIRSNSAVVGNRAGLALSGGTLSNTSGAAITVSTNPTLVFSGDFNFGTTGGTSLNDLNLGTGAAALGTSAGTTRTITGIGSSTLTVGSVIANGTTANSITKAGTGTLNLTGNSTFTGAASVTGGTLLVSGAGAINTASGITINGSGAKFIQTSSIASTPAITVTQGTLDGTGSVGSVTVGNGTGGFVANGNGGTTSLSLSNLTFGGAGTANLALNGASAGMAVGGALTTTGTSGLVTVNASNAAGWANGSTYNLISYGSFTGAVTDFTKGTITGLSGRQSATIGIHATSGYRS